MRYLIAQQWPNLEGNHAGYPHICKLLQEKYPSKYKLIELESPASYDHNCSNSSIKRLFFQFDKIFNRKYYFHYLKQKCGSMLRSLKSGDEVFLLEYNLDATPQYDFALYIKKHYKDVKIYAMTHLTPSYLEQNRYGKNKILLQSQPIDVNITLGSSLSEYFSSLGISNNKISTGFHAVDTKYYRKDQIVANKKLTIISIGALQRNFELLSQIVRRVEDVNWIICAGKKNVSHLFENCKNVEIRGFMPEDELRDVMDSADFSLNVLDDTIGSNVITTSLAMGLGLFVSDVGSIRDYCDETNAFFCENNAESFVSAINRVKSSPEMIINMRISSLSKSKSLSIENTDKWFDGLSNNSCF